MNRMMWMCRKPLPLNVKVQYVNYDPEQEKENINAIKELLATALFEMYKHQQNYKHPIL